MSRSVNRQGGSRKGKPAKVAPDPLAGLAEVDRELARQYAMVDRLACFPAACIVLEPKVGLDYLPEHPLEIPPGWERQMDGDYRLSHYEFVPRAMALGRVASQNRGAMLNSDENKPETWPKTWALAFEVGHVASTSHVSITGGCRADFMLDSCLLLVRPTRTEVDDAVRLAGKVGAQ